MKKNLLIFFLIAIIETFTCTPQSEAIGGDVGYFSGDNWGTSLTVPVDIFGADYPPVATSYSGSNRIQIAGRVEATGNYFFVIAQHKNGDKAYAMHSNGGLFFQTVATGTFIESNIPAAPTDSGNTDFAGWSKF